MQGPHAFARMVATMASRSWSRPSRSMVARTRSDPGVTSSGVFTCRPPPAAWRAIDAVRELSSYVEFVQEPISAELILCGQPFSLSYAPTSDLLCAYLGG